jgi:hypothetical protein
MLDALTAPGCRRRAGMQARACLDRRFRVGAEHHVAGFKQLAFPAPRIQVEHRAGLLKEVRVARKDPRPVLPRADRVVGQPPPDRRRRRVADGLLDDEAMQLSATEARQWNDPGTVDT